MGSAAGDLPMAGGASMAEMGLRSGIWGRILRPVINAGRTVKKVVGILTALYVAFVMAARVSAHTNMDWVTRGLLCIHTHEGSWRDPGAPYYGGLQMDWSFMQTYGRTYLRRWGTADHWPVWAQIQAGRNGYRARGWYPWPNTARYCGLL